MGTSMLAVRWSRGRLLPALAAVLFLASAAGFGAALPGYAHAGHPLALLGARGVPHASAFNAIAFLAPGLLLACAALGLRARLAAGGMPARVGAMLAGLSALAFAAQGLFPLDPAHLDSGDSRYHATAWTLWWIAFVPGAALLATQRWRRPWHLAAAVGVPLLVLVAPALLGAAVAQRAAVAMWFAWWLVVGGQGPGAAHRADAR